MKKQTTKPASTKPAAKKAVAKNPAAKNPAAKKPPQKKPATKTSPSKPKRKAQNQPEFGQIVDRLDAIMDRVNELLRMAQTPHANPTIEPMHQPTDEHTDDVEIGEIRDE